MMKMFSLLFIMLLVGCSNSLSRKEAKMALLKNEDLWQPHKEIISVTEGKLLPVSAISRITGLPWDSRLEKAGYIEVKMMFKENETNPSSGERYSLNMYEVSLCDKLRPFIVKSRKGMTRYHAYLKDNDYGSSFETECRIHDVEMPLWEVHMKDITGIRDTRKTGTSGCDSIVSYTIERSFSDWASISGRQLPPSTEELEACFILQDDGWKLR